MLVIWVGRWVRNCVFEIRGAVPLLYCWVRHDRHLPGVEWTPSRLDITITSLRCYCLGIILHGSSAWKPSTPLRELFLGSWLHWSTYRGLGGLQLDLGLFWRLFCATTNPNYSIHSVASLYLFLAIRSSDHRYLWRIQWQGHWAVLPVKLRWIHYPRPWMLSRLHMPTKGESWPMIMRIYV